MKTSDRQLSEILSQFARTMVTDFPIQSILEELVRRIVELMEITGAGVTLISDTSSPHYVAASDSEALKFEELQTVLNEGPCLVAYETGEAVSIPDLHDEERFPGFVEAALEAGLVAVFTLPLRQNDQRLGALDLYRNTAGPLTKAAMVVAQTLADVVSAYLVNAQGRSDLIDSSSRARAVALHDALTGLPNRTLLSERIEHALLARRRSGKLVAVLFIDLDGFKKINDNNGHQAGDDVLIAVSSRMTHLLRPEDTLARMSGDEFIVVCEGLDEEGQIYPIAERIINAISWPFDFAGSTVYVAASVGVAFAGGDNNAEDLLHQADLAMYQAKRKGGSNYQVFDATEGEVVKLHDSLKRDLGYAAGRGELHLEYQPVVSAIDGRVATLEALLRWEHPRRGLISPAMLIPLAEVSGEMVKIGQWVLEKACVDRHRWESKTGDKALVMAVNVSGQQLMAAGFLPMVEAVLSTTDTQPRHLCLDITESSMMEDPERTLTVLSQLKALGVNVALDNFGTGYSSFRYLTEYPVDIVKIGQSSVAKLTHNEASHAIVAKTIELAHLLNMVVICEGIETAEQDREVTALESDFRQGFYFSPPMSADDIDELMSEATSAWTIPLPQPV